MKKKYVEEVAPALMTKFQYASVMQIPKIEKIVVSVGCGDCKDNAKALDAVSMQDFLHRRKSDLRAVQISFCLHKKRSSKRPFALRTVICCI